ncbi:hypothetical protein [Micromonospora saelicesensis]|nr:hypothetical protein [Micromonospora saelicesensis]RAO42212.1 hypothetical protein PSN01_06246 [Micromonospora saelicesensis]
MAGAVGWGLGRATLSNRAALIASVAERAALYAAAEFLVFAQLAWTP